MAAVSILVLTPDGVTARNSRADFAKFFANRVVGDVFVMTNSTDETRMNEIVMYNRLGNGGLKLNARFPTGGAGTGAAPTSSVTGNPLPVPADGMGSQNSLILASYNRCLLAANGGSDSVSSFRVFRTIGLRRTSIVNSGGTFRSSLAVRGSVVYVLNSGLDGNVNAFRLRRDCSLTEIPNSKRDLADFNDSFPTPEPGEVLTTPAQVSYSPDGRRLVVSVKGGPDSDFGGRLVVFPVGRNGLVTGDGVATELSVDANTGGPFGFVFTRGGQLVVTQVNSFTLSTYTFRNDNRLESLAGPVATGGDFPCWIARNGGFVYVANFGSIPGGSTPNGPGLITGFAIGSNGSITSVSDGAALATFPTTVTGNHAIDIATVRGGLGTFLYALQPRTGTIGAWRTNRDGTLVSLGETAGLRPGVDPNAPETLEFTERCFSAEEPSPECDLGSPQGIVGY